MLYGRVPLSKFAQASRSFPGGARFSSTAMKSPTAFTSIQLPVPLDELLSLFSPLDNLSHEASISMRTKHRGIV